MSARLASVCALTNPIFSYRPVCFECDWIGREWVGREAALNEVERHNLRRHARGLAA